MTGLDVGLVGVVEGSWASRMGRLYSYSEHQHTINLFASYNYTYSSDCLNLELVPANMLSSIPSYITGIPLCEMSK
jgi:hypothetical protein